MLPSADSVGSSEIADAASTAVPQGWPGQLCPNLEAWEPGDVILVGTDHSRISGLIVAAQRTHANPAARRNALWVHAGIYVGNGDMVDASKSQGVRRRCVWDCCRHRPLRLRRLHGMAPADGQAIAQAAVRHCGKRYSLQGLAVASLGARTEPDGDKLFCSALVGRVIADVTALALWNLREYQPFYPAVLAEHPELADIALRWHPHQP